MMQRCAALAFMATVTCYLLGRVFAEAGSGPEGFAEVVVYGVTATFGLEFLIASGGRFGGVSCAKFAGVTTRRSDTLKASPRMFESDLLDRLSRVHPKVPLFIFIPAIAVLFALGQEGVPPLPVIALLLGGYVFWTLTEYWMHRVVFHFEPEDGIGARIHFIIHGVHHDHPNDPMRLVMPPSVSVPLALAFLGLFVLVMGTPAAYLFCAGFLCGYLIYDMTHYHVHHKMPRTRFGRMLRELHMRHHFQDDTRGFGVSAPVWDRVFGTRQRRGRA